MATPNEIDQHRRVINATHDDVVALLDLLGRLQVRNASYVRLGLGDDLILDDAAFEGCGSLIKPIQRIQAVVKSGSMHNQIHRSVSMLGLYLRTETRQTSPILMCSCAAITRSVLIRKHWIGDGMTMIVLTISTPTGVSGCNGRHRRQDRQSR